MGIYLNKIGLLKYNNTTYKPVGDPQYYTVKDPGLVSSDPNFDFFSYPWKTNSNWSYNNYGQGWFYNGKQQISYTLPTPITSSDISSRDPDLESQTILKDSFVYNVMTIPEMLLTGITTDIQNSTQFDFPEQMFMFQSFSDHKLYKVKYNNDFRAYDSEVSSYTYVIVTDSGQKPLIIDYPPPSVVDDNKKETPYVSGYWTNDDTPICGFLKPCLNKHQGDINDIYSNELVFKIKSPNLNNVINTSSLPNNQVRGLFNSIPGTDLITGICTTKMLFIDNGDESKNQYVYMRGLFKGNIDITGGVTNEIKGPSTVIRKVKVKNLQGTLKNISDLPQQLKFNLNHYYAWGWLYGVDNISYTNIWYKNEISGLLTSDMTNQSQNLNELLYTGKLTTTITTTDGENEINNILSGTFTKEDDKNIITGFLEGVIKPFNIEMKGYVSGYYNIINRRLKPLQLSGVLFNKSIIGDDLRQILDIKYANTLGRKELSYSNSLYGQNLSWATKNYDPYKKPYMLQTWKIVEYKTSNEEIDYTNYHNTDNSVDLNTYIAGKKLLQKTIHNTKESNLQYLINNNGTYYVYWDRDDNTQEFAIKCSRTSNENSIRFSSEYDAQIYIKHLCKASNLKIKEYIVNDDKTLTSYILESSDLEIK